jgi:D-amino-acid dehydrogenase
MLGLSMAPATGRLVAELLGGQPAHLDPAPYTVQRFQPGFAAHLGRARRKEM